MKKLLALVLALVMTLSLAVVGSNAAFKDAKDVNETYSEAVDVLSGMGVFNGYKNADGTYSFQPKGDITRAEVAAIVYRLYTADVTDKQASLYATYNKFSDMNGAAWAAGYIGYCANAGLIKGYDAKTFGPSDKVTGYQALAMILRAVGYDKNDEFTGAQWQLRVASTAQQLGILKNVKGVDLNAAASRELVAELLFRTAAEVPTVTYTAALGYSNMSALIGGTKNATLGYKNFGLTKDETYGTDAWGRPAYVWYGEYSGNAIYNKNSKDVLYATIQAKPDATYTTATLQCDIAKDLGLNASKTFDVYKNSGTKTTTQAINPLATTAKYGAQGQQVEVYLEAGRIVVIDTFLAKVVAVKDATYDKNGHLDTEATITLNVYDADASTNVSTVKYVLTNGETNYTYAVGDMVLLNAYAKDNANGDAKVTKDYWNNGTYGEIVSKADSVDGAQTLIWYNAAQHTVNGTTYNDAEQFHLDEADKHTTNYTWYFDQFGNLIGDVAVATQYSYAVVSDMWWAGDAATGLGVAKANLVYMDGSKNTVTVSGVKVNGETEFATPTYAVYDTAAMSVTGAAGARKLNVATYAASNAATDSKGIILDNLFAVSAGANDTVVLEEVTTEMTGAKVTPKYSLISGAASKSGATGIYTNSNTQYLVYNTTSKTFDSVKDFNNIYAFTSATAVDYKVGTDGYAQYVYIYGTPDAATASKFVMVKSANHSALLEKNAVKYYEVTLALVDGGETTLKVKADNTATLNKLLAGVNKLFYVEFEGDYAKTADEITGMNWLYRNNKLGADNLDASVITNATRTGNDIASGNFHFNVTSATAVVGELPEGELTGKMIYIIHDFTTNVASKVYVVADPNYNPSTGSAISVANVNVSALAPTYGQDRITTATITAVSDKDGNFFNGTQLAATNATVTWQKLGADGNYAPYTSEAFVAGQYRAIITLTTTATNAAGQPYEMPATVHVDYAGTIYNTSVFTTAAITVAQP